MLNRLILDWADDPTVSPVRRALRWLVSMPIWYPAMVGIMGLVTLMLMAVCAMIVVIGFFMPVLVLFGFDEPTARKYSQLTPTP